MRRAALVALVLLAACGRRAVGPGAEPPVATPADRPAAAAPSLDGARRCEVRRGGAEVWAGPCAIAGGQLTSEDGSLAGALAPSAGGAHLRGTFRGGPLALELFALGDALVGAVVLDGAATEITVAPR